MFLGEYQHTIDAKGRLAIPAKFRGRLERGAVLVPGVERCLYVYPIATLEDKARDLESRNLDATTRRAIERAFFHAAAEVELDAQGRIVVPPAFRRRVGLETEVTVIGANGRFEIWSRAEWDRYQDELAQLDLAGLDLPF